MKKGLIVSLAILMVVGLSTMVLADVQHQNTIKTMNPGLLDIDVTNLDSGGDMVSFFNTFKGPNMDIDIDQDADNSGSAYFENKIVGRDLTGSNEGVETLDVNIDQDGRQNVSFVNTIIQKEDDWPTSPMYIVIRQYMEENSYASNYIKRYIKKQKGTFNSLSGLLDFYQKINPSYGLFENRVLFDATWMVHSSDLKLLDNEAWEGPVDAAWADLDQDGDSDPNAAGAFVVPAHRQVGFTQSLEKRGEANSRLEQLWQKFTYYGEGDFIKQNITKFLTPPFSSTDIDQSGVLNSKTLAPLAGGKAQLSQSIHVDAVDQPFWSSPPYTYTITWGTFSDTSSDVVTVSSPGPNDFEKSVAEADF